MAARRNKAASQRVYPQITSWRATTNLGGCKRTLQRGGDRAALVDRGIDRGQSPAGSIDGSAADFAAEASMVSGAQVDRHHRVSGHLGAARVALVPSRPAAGRDARLATAQRRNSPRAALRFAGRDPDLGLGL